MGGQSLDDLILTFRSRDIDKKQSDGAAQSLIDRFQGLIRKYQAILTTGSFNPKDQLVVFFLSLLKEQLRTSNPISTGAALSRALSRYAPDELLHVCSIAVLTTAAKYQNIAYNYHFGLSKLVIPMLEICVAIPEDFQLPDIDIDHPIDAKWVSGDTCGPVFARLTEDERRIIKLVWHQKLPNTQICGLLGLSLPTLLEKKSQIANKLWRMVKR